MKEQFDNSIIMSMEELYTELEKSGWKDTFDEEEFERKWNLENRKEYVIIVKDGYRKAEHRVVWEEHNGEIPKNMIIHHKNGNEKDNRIENLQMVTFEEHMKIHKDIKKMVKKENIKNCSGIPN